MCEESWSFCGHANGQTRDIRGAKRERVRKGAEMLHPASTKGMVRSKAWVVHGYVVFQHGLRRTIQDQKGKQSKRDAAKVNLGTRAEEGSAEEGHLM